MVLSGCGQAVHAGPLYRVPLLSACAARTIRHPGAVATPKSDPAESRIDGGRQVFTRPDMPATPSLLSAQDIVQCTVSSTGTPAAVVATSFFPTTPPTSEPYSTNVLPCWHFSTRIG
jgi:hypothetical protein